MSKGIQGIKGIKRSENIDRNCKIFHVTRKLAKEKDFFWNHQHYSFFMKVLAKYLESVGGRLMYFCIMPTHYHLIVYVPNYEMLAEVMRHVDLSFSKHLYHKEKTLGSVWVGKLWSRGICDDKDLFDTMKYLYDNPERAHIDQPENYRKSSAHECASYFSTKLLYG